MQILVVPILVQEKLWREWILEYITNLLTIVHHGVTHLTVLAADLVADLHFDDGVADEEEDSQVDEVADDEVEKAGKKSYFFK